MNILLKLLFLIISISVSAQNLALNSTVIASSEESGVLNASNAVDGDYTTRWSSAFSDPQWIRVDFGNTTEVSKVVLYWEGAYATQYEIQVSTNGQSWSSVSTQTTADGGTDTISFPAVSTRYLRMYGTQRATVYGYSLYELEVYGPVSPSNAKLQKLYIDGVGVPSFNPSNYNYTYTLGPGLSDVPVVTASTQNPNATYNVDPASSVPGTTKITVTAEDGTLTQDYSIAFQLNPYVLVWGDEFENNESVYKSGQINPIDPSKWFHQTYPANGGAGWFNGEQQHYTDRLTNSYVSDGTLKIKAVREPYENPQTGSTQQYTSARLNSKYAFTYGRVDVRAKLPLEQGTWPAIWTLGQNITETGAYWQTQGYGAVGWPACGEIDIMEQDANKAITSGAFHFPNAQGAHTYTYNTIDVNDTDGTWHDYSMIWTADGISLMVDGVEFHNSSQVDMSYFQNNHFLLLNIAMGGDLGGDIAPNFSSAIMEIDYVRVYEEQTQSVSAIDSQKKLTVYPNPSQDYITISSQDNIDFLSVYSISGQQVFYKAPIQKEILLPIDFPPGLYMIQVQVAGQKLYQKLIVE